MIIVWYAVKDPGELSTKAYKSLDEAKAAVEKNSPGGEWTKSDSHGEVWYHHIYPPGAWFGKTWSHYIIPLEIV